MAVKYRFRFGASDGVDTEILVSKDGYTGSVLQRPLGANPVLHMQTNGRVCGTSLDFCPQCNIDGEFAEFYTSNPKEYLVQLKRDGSLVWSGYITPELYSEPDIAPPYDVRVTATDGIGELKLYEYEVRGLISLREQFEYLLGHTAQGTTLNAVKTIGNATFWDAHYIDIDYKAGESCYDVLLYLLDTFNARLLFRGGVWWLIRETDISISRSGAFEYVTPTGTYATESAACMTMGQRGVAELWPIGYTSTEVVPAKSRVRVTAPWHFGSVFAGWRMLDSSGWTATGATYDTTHKGWRLLGVLQRQKIEQTVACKIDTGMRLVITAAMATGTAAPNSLFTIRADFAQGSSRYYLMQDSDSGEITWGGTSASDINTAVNTGPWRENATEFEFVLPPVPASSDFSGDLHLSIMSGSSVACYIYGVQCYPVAEDGYIQDVTLNNGARGGAEEAEIAVGYVTDALADNAAALAGVLKDSEGNLVSDFGRGRDFLSFMARDYALCCATARLRTTGTVNAPSDMILPPIAVMIGANPRLVESYDWDLFEQEMALSVITLPAAILSTETYTLTPVINAQKSYASGSTGGGGGTAGVTSVGLSMPSDFEVSGSPVTGAGTISVSLKSGRLFVNQTEKNTWNAKQSAINDLQTIRDNAGQGAQAYQTIGGYGNIVGHNVSEFATAAQGLKADAAVQGGAIGTLTAPKKIIVCEQYPTVEDPDAIYLLLKPINNV